MLETLELIKRTIPTNSGSLPPEVFGIIRQALLAHLLGRPCENATADIGHIPAFGQDHSPAVARTVCAVERQRALTSRGTLDGEPLWKRG